MTTCLKNRLGSGLIAAALAAVISSSGIALAGADVPASWPQWRGPNHDDVVVGDNTHIALWTNKGPLKVWYSPPIPSAGNGGLGSVVVADGRVYVFATPKTNEVVTSQTLPEGELRAKLGWSPIRLPTELNQAVEEARISDERAALKPNELNDWIKKFSQAHLTTDDARRRYEGIVNDRLNRGTNAIPWNVLDTLATMTGRAFSQSAELEKWFDAHEIPAEVRNAVLDAIPRKVERAEDVIYCLNAADGKLVWKRGYPGVVRGWGACSTPCVADGRVYVLGSDCALYCLNARDGTEVWTTKPNSGERHASFVVVDGLAIVEDGALLAYDAVTGVPVWSRQEAGANNNTPTPWIQDGKAYLLCNTEGQVSCVDPRIAGKLLWTAPGGSYSTAAVSGDRMVVFNGRQLLGYRISLEKAEPLWKADVGGDRGASPVIYKNRAYLAESGRTVCVNMDDGKVLWDGKTGTWELGSAVAADDKIIAVGDRTLYLMNAAPEAYDLLAKVSIPVAECTTPAIVGNRMYIRLKECVGCFDLSQPAPQP